MTMTTIVLADDHPIVRQGLRSLLEAEPDFRVVGEAADGIEAVQQVERLRPNVLVLDLMMPGLSGLEVTRQVSQRFPQTRVIILSMHANEPYVLEAVSNGATGYVLKKSTTEELVQAIREVLAGRRYLSPPFSEEALKPYLQKTPASPEDPYELLTPREREVLHLVAAGHTSAEIAQRLVVSPRTVESHRANLMRKLNMHHQADLIRYALQRGILTTPDEP
jgi:DNA-binding NarL/FixJ family response regulator